MGGTLHLKRASLEFTPQQLYKYGNNMQFPSECADTAAFPGASDNASVHKKQYSISAFQGGNKNPRESANFPLKEYLGYEDEEDELIGQAIIQRKPTEIAFQPPKTTVYGNSKAEIVRTSGLPGYQPKAFLNNNRPGTTYAETRMKNQQDFKAKREK